MKRVVLIILCLLLLVGCGKNTKDQSSNIEQSDQSEQNVPESESSQEELKCPKNMSQQMFEYGLKALDVAEQCFNADISFDEAKKKLDELWDLSYAFYEKHADDDPGYMADVIIPFDINAIYYAIGGQGDLEDSIENLRNHLNGIIK